MHGLDTVTIKSAVVGMHAALFVCENICVSAINFGFLLATEAMRR